jgi:hypothetical protein
MGIFKVVIGSKTMLIKWSRIMNAVLKGSVVVSMLAVTALLLASAQASAL